MLLDIVKVALKSGYVLHLEFEDGTEGDVDISQVITFDGVFEAFKDQSLFDRVRVDPELGTIAWPGDLDLAPEPLYERITGRNPMEAEIRALEEAGLVRAAEHAEEG